MHIQVMMPSPASVDFNIDTTSTSPFVSPTPSEIPFNWEETPVVAANKTTMDPTDDHNEENIVQADGATIYTELDDDYVFEFDFSGQLETQSLTADELFDDGKIKLLKPPPHLFYTDGRLVRDSPKRYSPHRSPKRVFKEANLSFKEALSPKHRRKNLDPFSEAIKQTLSSELRGRERISTNSTPIRHKLATRCLSPYRVSDMLADGELNRQHNSKESYSTWLKLRDLLLFRSASEGSATRRKVMNRKNSSIRSTDSWVGSTSRRVSAHEMHYTENRAVKEEMRRKTFLPYRRGLLGCLGFTTHVQRDF